MARLQEQVRKCLLRRLAQLFRVPEHIIHQPQSLLSLSGLHSRFHWDSSTGGIDLELAPQVVTALDDVCLLSPRSFDTPSLTALLGEVCLWLVEQRIGPRAQHAKYKTCDPYGQVGYVSLGLSQEILPELCAHRV